METISSHHQNMSEIEAHLRERIRELEAIVAQQAEIIERLQRRLDRDSSTSSKPPSSDSPNARSQRKKRRRSTRKQGAQTGHEPHQRAMLAHLHGRTYGPGVAAMSASLSGPYRMSRRTTREFLRAALGVPVSLGSVSVFEQRARRARPGPRRGPGAHAPSRGGARRQDLVAP